MNRKTLFGVSLVVVTAVIVVGLLLATRSEGKDSGVMHIAVVFQNAGGETSVAAPLVMAMNAQGYTEGETVAYQLLSGDSPEALRAAVEAAQGTKYDLIFAFGQDELQAVVDADLNGPRVFYLDQPALTGEIAALLGQPDASMTGAVLPVRAPKRLELLLEIDPSIQRIFVPYSPADVFSLASFEALMQIEDDLGVALVPYPYTNIDEFKQGMAEIPAGADAVFMISSPGTTLTIPDWATACLRLRIPLSIGFSFPVGDTLMGYGPNPSAVYKELAYQADRILNGTPAGDIPFETVDVTSFIHLGVADALGIKLEDTTLRKIPNIVRDPVTIPAAEGDALAAEPAEGTCQATLTTPFGAYAVCISQHCDALIDQGPVTYSDQVVVESCAAEGVVGTCQAPKRTVTFYSGDPSVAASLCDLNNGTWTAAE